MLFAIAVLVVAASQNQTEQATVLPTAQQLYERVDVVKTEFQRLHDQVEQRVIPFLDAPMTGLILESETESGPDGLHAMIVKATLKGSPARVAGVQPGDRLLVAGNRRITHETIGALENFFESHPGPMDMIFLRAGKPEFTVAVGVTRQPCLVAAKRKIDPHRWMRWALAGRGILTKIRMIIGRHQEEVAYLQEGSKQVEKLHDQVKEAQENINQTVDFVTELECK